MSGRLCDLCGHESSGGVVVVLRDPGHRVPATAWGKLCWTCLRPLGPWPQSPQSRVEWQQALDDFKTRREAGGQG